MNTKLMKPNNQSSKAMYSSSPPLELRPHRTRDVLKEFRRPAKFTPCIQRDQTRRNGEERVKMCFDESGTMDGWERWGVDLWAIHACFTDCLSAKRGVD